MNPSPRLLLRLIVALLGLATLLIGGAPPAAAEVTFQKESEQQWRAQLEAHEIASVTVNRRAQSVRTTLKDGRYVQAKYPKHQDKRIEAELRAKHVPYTVLTKEQADKLAKAVPHHHKWRYIIGGVLLGLAVIVGGLIFIRRRGPAD
jgi:hypothetical protein